MKKTTLFLFAFAFSLSAQSKTFTGVVTDEMCGMDHKMMNITPDAKCVTDRIRMGSKYVLVDGKNVYQLSDPAASAKFAAKKVKVSGTLAGKTITVKSIVAAN